MSVSVRLLDNSEPITTLAASVDLDDLNIRFVAHAEKSDGPKTIVVCVSFRDAVAFAKAILLLEAEAVQ